MLSVNKCYCCLILFVFVRHSEQQKIRSKLEGNNVCSNFAAFNDIYNSPDCWYDPDPTMKTPDLIKKYTDGAFEEHQLITDDGYILNNFRIPRQNPKSVVLLVPTMYMDTRLFMAQGNESTALLLWRDGYDIWFLNPRGTTYSEMHRNISIRYHEYWNYSFTELAQHDLRKTVQQIKEKTGSKMFVYGTSMATTVSAIYASLFPEEAKENINAFMLAGNSIYFKYSTSVLATVAPVLEDFGKEFVETVKLGNNFFAYETELLLFRYLFRIPYFQTIMQYLILFLFGWTPQQVDPVFMNADISMIVQDVPFKTVFHYAQIERAKTRFAFYDYGPEGNRKEYGTDLPPEYPLQNIIVPMFLLISDSDALTSLKDTENFFKSLPAAARKYDPVYVHGFNHGDYHYGKERKTVIIGNLLKFMDRFLSEN